MPKHVTSIVRVELIANFRKNQRRPMECATTVSSKRNRLHILFLRKEVIHRQLPLPMPCYDLAPVTSFGLEHNKVRFIHLPLPWLDGRCVKNLRTYSP